MVEFLDKLLGFAFALDVEGKGEIGRRPVRDISPEPPICIRLVAKPNVSELMLPIDGCGVRSIPCGARLLMTGMVLLLSTEVLEMLRRNSKFAARKARSNGFDACVLVGLFATTLATISRIGEFGSAASMSAVRGI